MDDMDEDVCQDGGCLRRILREGDGEIVEDGDILWVHYKGSFSDGTLFQESYKFTEDRRGFKFKVGKRKVVLGWDRGLVGLRVGSKVLLTLRSDYAYGDKPKRKCAEFFTGKSKIPPGSTLIFEVLLLSVGDQPSEETLQLCEYAANFPEPTEADRIINDFFQKGIGMVTKEMLVDFWTNHPLQAASYILLAACIVVTVLAAGWPIPWLVWWKGPFSTIGYLMMFWRWPWPWLASSVEKDAMSVGKGDFSNHSATVGHEEDYHSCLYEIAWRMWKAWLAVLIIFVVMWKIILFKIYVHWPSHTGWKLAYGRLTKIHFILLAVSIGADFTMFQWLNTDCPLLAPRIGESVAGDVGREPSPSAGIWFGSTFVFTSSVMQYSLMSAIWPLLIVIVFDDEGKTKKADNF